MIKKLNVANLVKLIVMVICGLILITDYTRFFITPAISFTWFGLFIDFGLIIITGIIYEDLFERD